MISVPTMLAVVVGLLVYKLADITIAWLSNTNSNQRVGNQTLPINLNYPDPTYGRVQSPFVQEHYCQIGNEYFAKYSTVYQHMQFINYKLISISVNSFVTHHVVKITFESIFEHQYDIRWNNGITEYNWETKIPMEELPLNCIDDPSFNHLIEYYAMIRVWNYYYNKYPQLMLYPAMIGRNRNEHECLR